MLHPNKVSIDKFELPQLLSYGIAIDVLRLDNIHPVISGNKFFKLSKYIEQAILENKKGIITFGGAWSNHIYATAAACKENGLLSIGIIRGEEPASYSSTLTEAQSLGMNLFFVSRSDYSEKKIPTILKKKSDEYIIVNEGGYGELGAAGISGIDRYFNSDSYSHICCAVGTGTMLAGLVNRFTPIPIIGISVLKNNYELSSNIENLLFNKKSSFHLMHDFHFGGYAKTPNVLIEKMNEYYTATGIPTDRVYTSKLFYAAECLVQDGYFPKGSKVLLIHSGGLQGNNSLPNGTLIF